MRFSQPRGRPAAVEGKGMRASSILEFELIVIVLTRVVTLAGVVRMVALTLWS